MAQIARNVVGIRRLGAPPKPVSKRTPPRRVTTRPLTPRQTLFIQRYLLTLNATQAYQESHPGCTWSSANANGSHLLRDNRIAQEVKARLAAVTDRYRAESDAVLSELASLAFSDIRDLFDRDGGWIPVHDLPARVTAAIKKLKSKEIARVDEVTGKRKVVGHLREVELADKIRPLQLLGLHEGLFTPKVELQAGTGFAEALRELRERAAKAG